MSVSRKLARFYIDGARVTPREGHSAHTLIDPAAEQVSGEVAFGSAADIDRAVAAARRAFPAHSASAMMNIPLVDQRLALRLVGTYKYTGGRIDRVVVDPFPIGGGGSYGYGFGSCTRGDVQDAPVARSIRHSNTEHLYSGRVGLRFRPNDVLTADFLLMHQNLRLAGSSQTDIPPSIDTLAHYQPFDVAELYDDTFDLYSLTLNYGFDFADLTSATANLSCRGSFVADVSEVFQSAAFGYAEVESEVHWQAVAATDACRHWWRYMADVMPTNRDSSPVVREMREVFHIG